MENILTIAGFSQLILAIWAHDRFATVPALVLAVLIFGGLVYSVRQILKENAPAPKRTAGPRRVSRVV